MKFTMIVLSSAMFLAFAAHAKDGANAPRNMPECQGVFKACQAAGFKVGAHKKGDKEGTDSGLWVDCIAAVADGKKQVNGVDQSAAQACKTALKARRAGKS